MLAVWLSDPREEEIPAIGPLVLEDAETGEQVYVDTRDKGFQQRFRALVEERRSQIWQRTFARHGVDVLRLSTDGDLVQEIARFAHLRREARRRSAAAGGGRGGGYELRVAVGAGCLLVIVPVLAGLYVWMQTRRRRYALRYASVSLVQQAVGKRPRRSGATSRRRSTCWRWRR